MTTAEAGRRHDGVREIDDWVSGYVERHPRASINTVGDQAIMAVRTIQTLFVDLFTGKFQWKEFVHQAAFMAGTSVMPTIFVALPIGVTLSVQFALLAGQVGATSLAGAASGLAVIRQAASLVAAILMASAVGSAITADPGARKNHDVRQFVNALHPEAAERRSPQILTHVPVRRREVGAWRRHVHRCGPRRRRRTSRRGRPHAQRFGDRQVATGGRRAARGRGSRS